MTRKFSESAKVWLRAYGYDLGRGDGNAARRTLDRSIGALPARKHIKVWIYGLPDPRVRAPRNWLVNLNAQWRITICNRHNRQSGAFGQCHSLGWC
jgi:hypothetical protein